jgi:hypothetical protein
LRAAPPLHLLGVAVAEARPDSPSGRVAGRGLTSRLSQIWA